MLWARLCQVGASVRNYFMHLLQEVSCSPRLLSPIFCSTQRPKKVSLCAIPVMLVNAADARRVWPRGRIIAAIDALQKVHCVKNMNFACRVIKNLKILSWQSAALVMWKIAFQRSRARGAATPFFAAAVAPRWDLMFAQLVQWWHHWNASAAMQLRAVKILPRILPRLHGLRLTTVQEIPNARFVSSQFSLSDRELLWANPFNCKIEERVAWERPEGSLLHTVDECNVWNKLFNFWRSRKDKCLSITMAENQPWWIPNACNLSNDHCWQGTKWPYLWDYTKLFGPHLLSSNWVGCTALCWDGSRKGNWSTPFFVWGKPARELIKQEGNWVRSTSGRLNLICATEAMS